MTGRVVLVAGGPPSSVSGLREHFAHETLDQTHRTDAEYYQKGGEAPEDGAKPQIGIIQPDMHPMVRRGLGLDDGQLTDERIDSIMSGHAADGTKIKDKIYSVRHRGDKSVANHTGSIIISPAPDKTVSVAWAFAPKAEQALIHNAHLNAARAAVGGFFAEQVGQIRVGKNGEDGRVKGHIGSIEFTHYTSRRSTVVIKNDVVTFEKSEIPGDMGIHTHFVIPATVWTDDGKVGSLDTRTALNHEIQLTTDAYYQAELSRDLRTNGFPVALDQTRGPVGVVRFENVPDRVRDVFSKRTNDGTAAAKIKATEGGKEWSELTDEQRATRTHNATQHREQKVKGEKDDVADFKDWERQAKEAAWEIPQTFREQHQGAEISHEQRIRRAYEIALPRLDEQFQKDAVLSEYALERAALAGLIEAGYRDKSDVREVVGLMRAEGVMHNGQRVSLIEGQEPGKLYQSVTTALHESQEHEFVRLARSAGADRSFSASPDQIDRAAATSGLDFSTEHGKAQLKAVHIIGEGGAFGMLIGRDGAGKSAMLQVMTKFWDGQGRVVYGTSLAREQSADMRDGGIAKDKAMPFSVLLDGLRDGNLELGRKSVVVVDEVGQIGTRGFLELLQYREKMGFSLYGIGDHRQTSAIEAGEIITLSRRALGPDAIPELFTTVRQQTEREREIVTHFRENRPDRAIAMKRDDGSAHMVRGGKDATIKFAVERYKAKLAETGSAALVLTNTNADAHTVSAAIRAERQKMGLIGRDLVTIAATDGDKERPLHIAVGDHVRLFSVVGCRLENGNGGRIGANRAVAEVQSADSKGMTIRLVKDGTVGHVRWTDLANDEGKIQLAWAGALTAYSAQGKTADHVLNVHLHSDSDGRNSFVQQSRHRVGSEIIVNASAEYAAVRQSRPINDARDVTVNDMWEHFERRCIASPPKALATSMIEQSQDLRRGAIKGLARHDSRSEHLTKQGERPSSLQDRMENDRISRISNIRQIPEVARQIQQNVHETAHKLAQQMLPEQQQVQKRGRSMGLGR